MTKQIDMNEVRATNPKELLVDYGAEVMALVQTDKVEELAQLTNSAYEELLVIIQPLIEQAKQEAYEAGIDDATQDAYNAGLKEGKQEVAKELLKDAEELSSGGTLHDDEGYIVLSPKSLKILESRYPGNKGGGK